MSNDPATDQACLLALQQGEAAALNRLIERWQRPLHSFAYRYTQNQADADDLVAQTFVKLYQQRQRLRADTRLSAWLFTTLTNLCHNHHRWKRRHPTVALVRREADGSGEATGGPFQEDLPSEQAPPDQLLEQDETQTAVRTAIGRLPHDLRVTLLLHHFDRLSYREIAKITGCSERGIETRLYRARQQLRDLLVDLLPVPNRR
ncbi:ECF RNA polymerase sigma-E factor [Lacunisphaera limnophila]|uniref:ECF RNA polymerase sigma-E factor n=1 Tax=Lacunisphaera limnophila TaxID=1838286 RepID=A0A1D8AW04_9BACT|nr:sigma-70 family RNA polymerase sigma factor [Lacunisphaera limnophila]AOS45067.1 ECF RNA polymerase sigma-E factor [Lacunisphaera limnophila]